MRDERFDLPLRIVVDHPVPGVAMALQRGASAKAELWPPTRRSDHALVFDFEVAVDGALPDGRPRFLGPCVQGPPDGRFVYLCIGQSAGQFGSAWSRRAKIPLGGLTRAMIEALNPGERLCARFNGRGRDDTPACASVRLLPPGWAVNG